MVTFKEPEIRVQDVMSITPIIIKKGETVRRAASLMKDTDVGCLIVLDDEGKLEGIITEMDIVFDTVAEGLDPDEVKVEDIMSSNVKTISGHKMVKDAAEFMAEEDIRHLPVVRDDQLIGIITENDIIELSPRLIEITREYAHIKYSNGIEGYDDRPELEITGYCESCKVYSERLRLVDAQLLCRDCTQRYES